jgi:hypothetical protein
MRGFCFLYANVKTMKRTRSTLINCIAATFVALMLTCCVGDGGGDGVSSIGERHGDLSSIENNLDCTDNFDYVGAVDVFKFGYTPLSIENAVSISNHGAVCDGITDDSAAIQAANDAAAIARVAVIYPADVTCVAHGITVTTDHIGNGVTLKIPDSADDWMFDIDVDEVSISGFTFDGNKANQPTPVWKANFLGVASKSLMQIRRGVVNLVIENNTFHDTQYGAVAMQDQTGTIGGTLREPNSVIIRNNSFLSIGRHMLWIVNPYEFATVEGENVYLHGWLIYTDNVGVDIGTIVEPAQGGHTNWGAGILSGGFNCIVALRNHFTGNVRADYKLGAFNDIIITDNTSIDASWMFLQTQTLPIDPVGRVLPGIIYVARNNYSIQNSASPETIGLFVQLKGNLSATPNHTIHPDVLIEDNTITYVNPAPPTNDVIQIKEQGRYSNIRIRRNTVTDSRRAVVSITPSITEDFETNLLLIENNVVTGADTHSWNVLLLSQLTGTPIRNVIIGGNTVSGTRRAITATSDSIVNFIMVDNQFTDMTDSLVMEFNDVTSMLTAVVRNNTITGKTCGLDGVAGLVWENNDGPQPILCP